MVSELVHALRAMGMRRTAPRRRIVDALGRIQHGAPAAVAAVAAADVVAGVADETGFTADLTHMAMPGWCADCERPR